jgi:hypothetical protein
MVAVTFTGTALSADLPCQISFRSSTALVCGQCHGLDEDSASCAMEYRRDL